METIHSRLKGELAARGLTAAEAARMAGEPDSQGLRDVIAGRKRLTAELLAALINGGTGIDAVYVLTGARTPAATDPKKREHRALLSDYDACAPKDQAALRRTAAALAQGTDARPRIEAGAVGQAVAGGKLVNKKRMTFNVGDRKK